VTGSTITNCNSVTGGGVYLIGGGSVTGSTITNCNSTNSGGVYLNDGNVTGSTITNCNSGFDGGGVYLSGGGSVSYCRITGNTAANYGKEAYVNSGSLDSNWWGDNNITELIKGSFVLNSYYQLQLTVGSVSTVDEVKNYTGLVPVSYGCGLVLNGTNDSTNSSNLPDFTGNTTLSNVLGRSLPLEVGVRSFTPGQSDSFNVPDGWNDILNSFGNYNLTAVVDNEDLSVNITVDKQDTGIGLDEVNTSLISGNLLSGVINLTNNGTGVGIPGAGLEIFINNVSIVNSTTDGSGEFNLSTLNYEFKVDGIYNLTVKYAGNDTYNSTINSKIIIVDPSLGPNPPAPGSNPPLPGSNPPLPDPHSDDNSRGSGFFGDLLDRTGFPLFVLIFLSVLGLIYWRRK
jgi:hypothetical protein